MVDAASEQEAIIGIDLGMTSVIAAYFDQSAEAPKVIPAEKNTPTLSAVVSFRDDDRPLVGRAAKNLVATHPELTIVGVKRLLGRSADSQAVVELQKRVGYKIESDHEQNTAINIEGRLVSPVEVAGLLLDQIRRFSEASLGKKVNSCVVSVPAYFNPKQKEAVIKACGLASMQVAKLVHEPTAVALAYGYSKAENARILIVDMGA